MPKQNFMIAPINSGLQKNVSPFLIPDDAFAVMNNAQISEGKVVKRFGSRYTGGITANQLDSRLKIWVGKVKLQTEIGTLVFGSGSLGQMFSIGDYTFNVVDDTAGYNDLLTNCPSGIHEFDCSNGNYKFTGLPVALNGVDLFFYPSLPVMGFTNFIEKESNLKTYYAFDPKKCYLWDDSVNDWLGVGLADGLNPTNIFNGTNTNFFSTAQYRSSINNTNVLTVVNNNKNEKMRFYNKTASTVKIGTPAVVYNLNANKWYDFFPRYSYEVGSSLRIQSAKIVKFFKNRIVLLGYTDRTSNDGILPATYQVHSNGVRWSDQNKDPFSPDYAGADPLAFVGGTVGTVVYKGGNLDAPIMEEIVAAEIYKDHLIVFFNSSVWELQYTHNDSSPFIWKLINDNRGASGINSVVDFDQALLSIDQKGITACNGTSVQEIDEKIPDELFQAQDSVIPSYFSNINGVRDFKTKTCYWTFPRSGLSAAYPYMNKVLMFNYESGSWSFIDDSVTCFGFFKEGVDAPIEERYERVVAGNQEGFVFIPSLDIYRNSGVLSITDMLFTGGFFNLDIIDHNLTAGDYVLIENVNTNPGDLLDDANGRVFKVLIVLDKNFLRLSFDVGEGYTGTYLGGGTLSRVTPPEIYTKQYGFYADKGLCTYVSKTDFMVSKTTDGEFTVDTYVSTASNSLLADSSPAPIGTGTLVGTNIVKTAPYPTVSLEANQTRLWHPVYLQASGEVVQLKFYLTDAALRADSQIRNTDIVHSNFTIHALLFEGSPSNRIL